MLTKLARGYGGELLRDRNTSGVAKPMDKLIDDLLLEFFSRVSYKSSRRITCVFRRWCDLIANTDNCQKLPQTLAGFFYHAPSHSYVDVSVIDPPIFDPSLEFQPDREREGIRLVDDCTGRLCSCCFRFLDPNEFDCLVMNLATDKWVAVSVTRRWLNKVQTVRLGFKPVVSSHFHVFGFQVDFVEDSDSEDDDDDGDGHVSGVNIYSSKTRLWS